MTPGYRLRIRQEERGLGAGAHWVRCLLTDERRFEEANKNAKRLEEKKPLSGRKVVPWAPGLEANLTLPKWIRTIRVDGPDRRAGPIFELVADVGPISFKPAELLEQFSKACLEKGELENLTKNFDDVTMQPAYHDQLEDMYRDSDPLWQWLEKGQIFAGLLGSGFVFSALLDEGGDHPQPGETNEWSHQVEVGGGTLEVDRAKRPDDLAPLTLRCEPQQSARGFMFRLMAPSVGDASGDYGEECKVRVRRWLGPSSRGKPPELPEVHEVPELKGDGAHTIPVGGYSFNDPYSTAQFEGQQVSYAFDVFDRHGLLRATASAVVFCERLAPPPAVQEAVAELPYEVAVGAAAPGEGTRVFVRGSVILGDEDPAFLRVAVYRQVRPRDPCGFYGDSDDTALLEGLRALDLSGGAKPTPPPNFRDEQEKSAWELARDADQDAGVRTQLSGQVQAHGLEVAFVSKTLDAVFHESEQASEDSEEQSREDSPFKLPIDPGAVLHSSHGVRLFVCLDRVSRSGQSATRTVQSPLTPCVHVLTSARGSETTSLQVFQLERIPAAAPPRAWLSPSEVLAEPFGGQPRPADGDSHDRPVRLRIRHPNDDRLKRALRPSSADGEPIEEFPVGGYRIWYRDVPAPGSRAPFLPADDIQVLPPLLAAYRPVTVDGSGDWSLERPTAGVSPRGRPTRSPHEHLDKVLRGISLQKHATAVTIRRDQPDMPKPSDPSQHKDHERRELERQRDVLLEQLALEGAATAGGPPDPDAKDLEAPRDVLAARFIDAMRQLGLAADVVLRDELVRQRMECVQNGGNLADLDGVLARRLCVADDGDTSSRSMVIIEPTDANGLPYATLTLVARPDPAWFLTRLIKDGKPPREGTLERFESVYKEVLDCDPVRRLRNQGDRPKTLAFDARREVSYLWGGISDGWHHDVQFAVECLDRYAWIRSQLGPREDDAPTSDSRDGTEPNEQPSPQELYAVPVSLERTREIDQPVGVVPVMSPESAHFAFRMIVPPEIKAAHANTASRTRLGDPVVEVDWGFNLLDATMYEACFLTGRPGGWRERVLEAVKVVDPPGGADRQLVEPVYPKMIGMAKAPTGEAERRKALLVLDDEDLDSDWSKLPPQEGTTLVEFGNTPSYYEMELSAALSADGLVGDFRRAVQTRRTRQIGLLQTPTFALQRDPNVPQKDSLAIHVSVVTTLLGNGLTSREREELEDSPVRTLGDVVELEPPLPEALEGLPVHLLPDLRLEYAFGLNIARPDEPPRLIWLFDWRGPLAHREKAPADVDDDMRRVLGFRRINRQTWLKELKVTPSHDGALHAFQLAIDVAAPSLDPIVLERLNDALSGQDLESRKGLMYVRVSKDGRSLPLIEMRAV